MNLTKKIFAPETNEQIIKRVNYWFETKEENDPYEEYTLMNVGTNLENEAFADVLVRRDYGSAKAKIA